MKQGLILAFPILAIKRIGYQISLPVTSSDEANFLSVAIRHRRMRKQLTLWRKFATEALEETAFCEPSVARTWLFDQMKQSPIARCHALVTDNHARMDCLIERGFDPIKWPKVKAKRVKPP